MLIARFAVGNWTIDLIKDEISVCQQMEMVAVNQAVYR